MRASGHGTNLVVGSDSGAELDVILDVRRELAVPLHRFRSAMLEFASEVEAGPSEPDFDLAVENLFRKRVEPEPQTLTEIAEDRRLWAACP